MEKQLNVKNNQVTFFLNFTKTGGNISIARYIELVKNGYVRDLINEIRRCDASGDEAEATRLKKTLVSITVAGLFDEGRKQEFFKGLTLLTVLDIDELEDEVLRDLRQRLPKDPHVMCVNTSVRGRGLKVIVPYQPENGVVPTQWDECRTFYTDAYNQVSNYFARTYGCKIDPSGKDITRLNFLSYDPDPYYNAEAEPFVVRAASPVVSEPPAPPKQAKAVKKSAKKTVPAYASRLALFTGPENISFIRRQQLLEVIINNLYRHKHRYVKGGRHNFLVLATHRLNELGIPQSEAEVLLRGCIPIIENLEDNPELIGLDELHALVRDIYTAEKGKFASEHITVSLRKQINMKVEINRLYVIRYNTLSERLEYIPRRDYEHGSIKFEDLNDKVLKDLVLASKEMNEELTETELRTIMESSFAPLFDPVKAYLDSCPEWDGHDHLADFADSIVVNDPERFRNILKMWFVGLIMSYQNDQIVNHIMIVLFTGSQGVGKTAALHRFFPPELRAHMFTPKACQIKKEEFASYVAHKLCIIVDELQKLDDEALDSLESDITIPKVDFRMPYAHYSSSRWHIASFLGASNNTSFMKGNHGNRRFHVFEVYKFNEFEPNYQQIFAQVRHLIETNFKYYFTAQEQDELAAYAYNFEDNTIEYDLVHKYIRVYPEEWKVKETHKVNEILQSLRLFNPTLVDNRSTQASITQALKRKGILSQRRRNSNSYFCYILTAEQVEYIAKHRNPDVMLDSRMDKYVPIEILIAHREAKIGDIEMAAQFYQQTKDIEKAEEMYARYLKDEFGNMFTNDMPF